MIRVTLEFATVEETILALGKMSALGKARRAANAPAPLPGAGVDEPAAPPSAAVPPAPPAGRKPRSDAGRPRGSYKKGAGDGKADANTAAPAPSAPPSPAAPEMESPASSVGKDHEPVAAGQNANAAGDRAAAGAAEVAGPGKEAEEAANPESTRSAAPVAPSAAEAQAALEALFNAKGIEAARKTLGAFGVQRLKDLKEADRAAFIAAVGGALE